MDHPNGEGVDQSPGTGVGHARECARRFAGYRTLLSDITQRSQPESEFYQALKRLHQEVEGKNSNSTSAIIGVEELLVDCGFVSDSISEDTEGTPTASGVGDGTLSQTPIKALLRLGIVDRIYTGGEFKLRIHTEILYWLLTNLATGTTDDTDSPPRFGILLPPGNEPTLRVITELCRTPSGALREHVEKSASEVTLSGGGTAEEKYPKSAAVDVYREAGGPRPLPEAVRTAQLRHRISRSLPDGKCDVRIHRLEVGSLAASRLEDFDGSKWAKHQREARYTTPDEIQRDEFAQRKWLSDVAAVLGYRSVGLLGFIIDNQDIVETIKQNRTDLTADGQKVPSRIGPLLSSMWTANASSLESVKQADQLPETEFSETIDRLSDSGHNLGYETARRAIREFEHGLNSNYGASSREHEHGWIHNDIWNLDIETACNIATQFESYAELSKSIEVDFHAGKQDLADTNGVDEETATNLALWMRRRNPLGQVEPGDQFIYTDIEIEPSDNSNRSYLTSTQSPQGLHSTPSEPKRTIERVHSDYQELLSSNKQSKKNKYNKENIWTWPERDAKDEQKEQSYTDHGPRRLRDRPIIATRSVSERSAGKKGPVRILTVTLIQEDK